MGVGCEVMRRVGGVGWRVVWVGGWCGLAGGQLLSPRGNEGRAGGGGGGLGWPAQAP
jgi:hypothetical protein